MFEPEWENSNKKKQLFLNFKVENKIKKKIQHRKYFGFNYKNLLNLKLEIYYFSELLI